MLLLLLVLMKMTMMTLNYALCIGNIERIFLFRRLPSRNTQNQCMLLSEIDYFFGHTIYLEILKAKA